MRSALGAYLWWLLGIGTAVALAWAYHRRLQGFTDGPATTQEEDPPTPSVAPPPTRPRTAPQEPLAAEE